jgi:hypothetical protein
MWTTSVDIVFTRTPAYGCLTTPSVIQQMQFKTLARKVYDLVPEELPIINSSTIGAETCAVCMLS